MHSKGHSSGYVEPILKRIKKSTITHYCYNYFKTDKKRHFGQLPGGKRISNIKWLSSG